ncbi:hypothetical protein J3R30DRAFT_3709771 [Lentinula aciculospora]|uniref:F-box domain-containing protein n=1 Tax=Lentinula aciculospora TaxID=153920 RepID=A0A9W9A1G2_9AGAR|nr:hypothetical protein J3R30DRAFT_3709771 [Lentinula aciculospora]
MATEHLDIHLPVELWSYIFLYLDTNCLRNSALTCSSLRWLARRYMYSRITIVCEYSWEAFVHSFKTFQRRGLTDTLDRLRFLASPDIAPFIRTCSLQFQTWPDPPFEVALNFLCDHLHLLVNLQQLEFQNILLTPRRATNISTLPSLKLLLFKECTMQAGPILSKISTRSLTISRGDDTIFNHDQPPRWLALVEPEKLLELRLVTSRATLEALSELMDTNIILPRLKSLYLNRDRKIIQCASLPSVVSKCPSLSNLHLLRKPEPERSSEVAILPEDFCSSLQGISLYDGPHFLISSFQEEQLRGLRRVRLFGDRWDGTCDMIGIRDDLWHLHRGAHELVSMHLRAFHTSETSAEDPMLALTRQPFLESLIKMTLPAKLKNLVVFGMIFSDSTEGSQDFWMTWSKTSAIESCTANRNGVSICRQLDVPSHWF